MFSWAERSEARKIFLEHHTIIWICCPYVCPYVCPGSPPPFMHRLIAEKATFMSVCAGESQLGTPLAVRYFDFTSVITLWMGKQLHRMDSERETQSIGIFRECGCCNFFYHQNHEEITVVRYSLMVYSPCPCINDWPLIIWHGRDECFHKQFFRRPSGWILFLFFRDPLNDCVVKTILFDFLAHRC